MAELTEYVAQLPPQAAVVVEQFRARALELVPGAEEGLGYGMPALRYRGRPLVSVMATKAGFSLFPFSADVVAGVLPQLAGFSTTKGGIRFTADRPVPRDVFDRMIAARVAEIDAAVGASGSGRGR